jgi:hypothetical protein
LGELKSAKGFTIKKEFSVKEMLKGGIEWGEGGIRHEVKFLVEEGGVPW